MFFLNLDKCMFNKPCNNMLNTHYAYQRRTQGGGSFGGSGSPDNMLNTHYAYQRRTQGGSYGGSGPPDNMLNTH